MEIYRHEATKRWLVSKIISINGEPYTPLVPEPKQKPKPKPKKLKPEKKIKTNQKKNRLQKDIEKSFVMYENKNTVLKYWERNIKFSLSDYSVNPLITSQRMNLKRNFNEHICLDRRLSRFVYVKEGLDSKVFCDLR